MLKIITFNIYYRKMNLKLGPFTIGHHSKEEPKMREPFRPLEVWFTKIARFHPRSEAKKNRCYNQAAYYCDPNLTKMWVGRDKLTLLMNYQNIITV